MFDKKMQMIFKGIRAAVKNLKDVRAAGVNSTCIEISKSGFVYFFVRLSELINTCAEKAKNSNNWSYAIIVPIMTDISTYLAL